MFLNSPLFFAASSVIDALLSLLSAIIAHIHPQEKLYQVDEKRSVVCCTYRLCVVPIWYYPTISMHACVFASTTESITCVWVMPSGIGSWGCLLLMLFVVSSPLHWHGTASSTVSCTAFSICTFTFCNSTYKSCCYPACKQQ